MISNVQLAHAPDLLNSSSGTQFSAIYHDAGTQYVGTIAGDGSIAQIGAGLADCCAMFSGISALQGHLLRVVARTLGTPDFSLYAVDRTTGTFQNIGTLRSGFVIHGLIESKAVLANDLIFADGFEIATALAGVDADKRLIDVVRQDPAIARNAGFNSNQEVRGDASVDAQFEADPKGHLPPSGATALPLGNVTLWAALILLMALIAVRLQRWRD